MGLDMYLHARKYVSGSSYSKADEQTKYNTVVSTVGLDPFVPDDRAGLTVELTVAYWRKAHSIHNWFVKNVQGGVDDCGSYYVTRDQLQVLRDLCVTGLTHYEAGKKGEAVSLLTPAPEFGPDDDETDWYADDLRTTVVQLDRVLAVTHPVVDFFYRSSW